VNRNEERAMSIKTSFTDRASDIAAFVAKHRTVVIVAAVAASLMGGAAAYAWYAAEPGRHHDYWRVPTKQPIPQPLQEAGRLSSEIDRHEATWRAEMDELTKLIEGQKPGEFLLSNEIATADAFRAYVAHLLRAGESAVETFVRMQGTARELNQLLKQAPAIYRQSASCARRFVNDTSWEDIKQNYQAVADIYEAKAKAAENHQNDVAANLNKDLLDYLKDQNVFMERLLTMLNQGLVSKDLREFARFKDTLQELISKHDFLRETLRTWRARVQGEPTAPKPEPEPRKSEAAPAAPPAKVKHVAWSSSGPATLTNPSTASAYWEQVREQEAAWEDEMSGLLKIVEEEQPAALRDPMKAASACVEHEITRRNEPSPYMEQLLRRGSAIEAAMVRVERTAHRVDNLLKQSLAPHRSPSDSRPITERDMLWALATIRRDGGQKADATQILQRVIQNEIKLIAGLLQELRNCNSCLCKHYHRSDFPDPDPARSCPSNFSETIQRAVEVHELVRNRLSNSRVRVLSESGSQPEPEPLQPEAPKANHVPIQPPRRQASFEPRPLPRPNLLVLGTR